MNESNIALATAFGLDVAVDVVAHFEVCFASIVVSKFALLYNV